MKDKLITGIIISSTDYYMNRLKGDVCKIVINPEGEVISAHRVNGGGGTYLSSKYDYKNTHYYILN